MVLVGLLGADEAPPPAAAGDDAARWERSVEGMDGESVVRTLKGSGIADTLQSTVKSVQTRGAEALHQRQEPAEPILAIHRSATAFACAHNWPPQARLGQYHARPSGRLAGSTAISVPTFQTARWVGLLTEMERVKSVGELPDVGDTVRVREVTQPTLGWGGGPRVRGRGVPLGVRSERARGLPGGSIGTCWTGLLDELEVVRKVQPSKGMGRAASELFDDNVLMQQARRRACSAGATQPGIARSAGRLSRSPSWASRCAKPPSRRGCPRHRHLVGVISLVGPLIWFGMLLGSLLSFASLLLDRPVSGMSTRRSTCCRL